MRLLATLAAVFIAAILFLTHGGSASAQTQNQTQTKKTEPAPVNVTVKEGDSLSAIAETNQTTWPKLFDANTYIEDPNIIHPGEVVRIPNAGEQLTHRELPTGVVAPVVASSTVSTPKPVPQAAVVASGSVWDSLAQCESGGNWSINTGNGYYGGLQFSASTWISNGGGVYAQLPNLATREQQIDIASRLQTARGWAPWPACASKLGLL